MSTEPELTRSDRGWLEHLRRAHAEGVTLVEYARAAGLKVGSLYEARRTLRGKGMRVPAGNAVAVKEQKPPEFLPVRVLPAPVSATTAVCRLRHANGWVIECAAWPEPAWMVAVLGERPCARSERTCGCICTASRWTCAGGEMALLLLPAR